MMQFMKEKTNQTQTDQHKSYELNQHYYFYLVNMDSVIIKKYFKLHFIFNFRSKDSSLVAKSSGGANNSYWKCIVRLQKVNFIPLFADVQ